MQLDKVDLKILDELQRDGSLSNVELAKRVHLSPSPCLARVKALEAAKVIDRYVAIASASLLWLRKLMEIKTLKPRPRAAALAIAT